MYIRPGRPDIFDTLQSVITGVRSAYSTSRMNGGSELPGGIVIGSCGPIALMDDAARAVGRVGWADWKDVGGVESVEECVCSFLLLCLSSPVLCSRDAEQGVWVVIDFPFIFFSSIAGQLQTLMALWRRFKESRRWISCYFTIFEPLMSY
jgi:hypothetical protein